MGSPLVAGSVTRCSFGLAPSVLNVLPVNRVLGSNLPVANILDSKPIVNIVPFGMCNSIANPTVAAATTAASMRSAVVRRRYQASWSKQMMKVRR